MRMDLPECKSELIDLQLTKKRTPEQERLMRVAKAKIRVLERMLGIVRIV